MHYPPLCVKYHPKSAEFPLSLPVYHNNNFCSVYVAFAFFVLLHRSKRNIIFAEILLIVQKQFLSKKYGAQSLLEASRQNARRHWMVKDDRSSSQRPQPWPRSKFRTKPRLHLAKLDNTQTQSSPDSHTGLDLGLGTCFGFGCAGVMNLFRGSGFGLWSWSSLWLGFGTESVFFLGSRCRS